MGRQARPSSDAPSHQETRKKKRKGLTSSPKSGSDQQQAAMPYREAPPSPKRCKVRVPSRGCGGRDAGVGSEGHKEAQHSPKRCNCRAIGASSPNSDKAAGDEESLRAEAVTILSRIKWREDDMRTDVVHGRFSKEEKQILREATVKYARDRGLSDVKFDWIYDKTCRGAIANIAKALPHRKLHAVSQRVTLMYHPGNYKGKCTVEEEEKLRGLVQQYTGNRHRWMIVGELMGRTSNYCRSLWRQIRLGDKRKIGKWSSEEENKLRLLVREQIAARKEKEAAELKLRLEQMSKLGGAAAVCLTPSNGREYRDRLDFVVLADKMGNRVYNQCQNKWYGKLSPSMFSSGEWALGDDITMVTALQSAGCEQPWEVEWDRLVPSRTAEQAKRRWKSMLRALPDYLEKRFDVCVDELAEKYSSHRCRQLLENLK